MPLKRSEDGWLVAVTYCKLASKRTPGFRRLLILPSPRSRLLPSRPPISRWYRDCVYHG